MLTSTQRDIVKATVPLLETGGEALTAHFYRILLAEHPEVRPLFNQAHQASGAQSRALAHGVLMYAKHIDRLEAIGGLAAQIVNKHVSLQVQPEHYPLVGQCLLRSIREVLGAEVATDAVIDAWAAAYGQLAGILIGAERAAYDSNAQAAGGWAGARAFRITQKVRESAEIVSFVLAPADGAPVMAFQPGQYIGLKLVIDGDEVRRNYSLSAAPNGQSYRISVKREAGGRVSQFLHDRLQPGDTIDLFPPAGEFVLPAGSKPLVLISGGVGITPLLAMLEAVLPSGRPVHFIHCARDAAVHAFRDTIDALAVRHPHLTRRYCYAEYTDAEHAAQAPRPDAVGLLSTAQLGAWLPASRDVEACFVGPKGFMQAVRRQLLDLGVPAAQTRWEFFGPASALA
ncbi:NO-inducible flavohemoprotein [Rhizobacter sp. Root1221]|uniref:NO-inducible flavohemoprotein n=1 Tax=Rhizobacter sp. Root1221 TaxID=1736433 RepID=UPI0006F7590E|nr:NO-inducible flavohemoprotein [Rhizobacter sp. Root1221]KQV97606.1 dihydropteridine reductase [Rhizobacter sp. Root1221]